MSRPAGPALLALALLCSLAPSLADGNIGCLFSPSLCIEHVEWCYDDSAFGKCIPVFDDQPEDGSLYQYDMTGEQLSWFEGELQRLVARGYRWDHAYTQCVLQAMLYTMRNKLDITKVNTKICDPFTDPKLVSDATNDENSEVEAEPEAYIRFTPNTALSKSEFANEVFSPPRAPDDGNTDYDAADQILITNDERPVEEPTDKIHDLILVDKTEDVPVLIPFGGFRERLNAEKEKRMVINVKEKEGPFKDLVLVEDEYDELPEDRRVAQLRKHKLRPAPFTAEYLTGNKLSPLDANVISQAQEKYRQSFTEKHFPFEYEDPDNEVPEPRIYFDDRYENIMSEVGSGEIDPTLYRDASVTGPEIDASKNMEYLLNYWKIIESKHKAQGQPLYAEGGPLRADDLQGSPPGGESGDNSKLPAELQGLLYNEWGFKRRERDDVKKPGPRLDAKVLKLLYSKNVTDDVANPHENSKSDVHNHNDFESDPSYAYVQFKNRFGTDWNKGLKFITKLEELLGLEKNTFTNPRVDPEEVTFKVEDNKKGLTAADVARQVVKVKDELYSQTGAIVDSTGVGDKSKQPVIRHTDQPDTEYRIYGIPVVPVFFGIVCSSLALVMVVYLYHRRKAATFKSLRMGLVTIEELEAQNAKYVEGILGMKIDVKWPHGDAWKKVPKGEEKAAAAAARGVTLVKEAEPAPPSARSSTSSWSEEPALTNMDISTGHMVLAYMEDHLRNKDRLEQEWSALCAYEAEPCATTAALRPENADKNRYPDVLPYDHSRVALNPLSNQNGSDYINASTITDHDPRNPAYIAAAGPLAHTAADFWQLVWEQGAVVCVMLTRLAEGGAPLCHRYWPEEGSQLYHIYEVHLVSEHIWCDDYLVRSFYLKNQRSGETRTVTQFHFLTWPENGVPASTKALLEFRRKVNKSYRGRSCPIVVHCSDGAGRTGTYCLIDMVLNRMAKGAKEIDIAATLEHIRDQRAAAVASKLQFEFVLMAVAEEVHAILKALPAHLQQLQEKRDKEKDNEKEKDGDKEK